ncbi:MAG: anion permease [Anaerolineae bacterium]|nr:anion permease [Anaerolineae bacterium]
MWIAILVFLISYIAISTEKFPRHWTAMLGGSVLLLTGVLSPDEALTYINWETIGLLAGMFTLVSILTEAGFFHWLAMTLLKRVNFHPGYLFVILILLAAFMAMFMDSITVMLFLSALTFQLCRLLNMDPVALIVAEVCAANTGGAATLVGDPPNVILGTTLGFSFADFVANTGPLSVIAVVLLLTYFYISNRKALKVAHSALNPETIQEIEKLHHEPLHAHLTRVGLTGFLMAVVLLVFHLPLSHFSGLPINAAVAAMVPAGAALIALKDNQVKKVILKVDGESILFFGGLFLLIGGLEKVQLFEMLAEHMATLALNSPALFISILHWGPGLMSGVVDNVPLALAMSYVLKDLAALPAVPPLALMVWSLALGVDIGGNLTPIGASANVVAYAFLEHHHGKVGWGRWLLIAAPPTLLAMIVMTGLLFLKGVYGWY